jgi:F-type H+-transporting ATPase subunit a
MLLLTIGASLITRKLTSDVIASRWQAALEILITGIDEQIKEVGLKVPEHYIAFIGTLFIFIATANLFTIIPGYEPPTGSLSTTAALAMCVFVAVPLYGIGRRGWRGYLNSYLQPTVIMLPFNHHQRALAHPGSGRPPVWQHDERYHDHRDSPHHHSLHIPGGDDRCSVC